MNSAFIAINFTSGTKNYSAGGVLDHADQWRPSRVVRHALWECHSRGWDLPSTFDLVITLEGRDSRWKLMGIPLGLDWQVPAADWLPWPRGFSRWPQELSDLSSRIPSREDILRALRESDNDVVLVWADAFDPLI